MMLSICRVLSFWLLGSSISLTSGSPASSYEPVLDAARRNEFQIFNTVHSAMRQWGSSVNPNGLSFFLAVVPEGNLFYHGSDYPGLPERFEWLAFEVEHASWFAQSIDPLPDDGDSPLPLGYKPAPWTWQLFNSEIEEAQMLQAHASHVTEDSNYQHRLVAAAEGDNDGEDKEKPKPLPSRGYFQTYRPERPLKLIYIDGMAAAKTRWGTLDSQDLILLEGAEKNITKRPGFGEIFRAESLCKMATEWGIDGWVRMEAGFEIIYCGFAPGAGLQFVSQHGSAFANETAKPFREAPILYFEWLRVAAQRYHGMSSGRIEVDWSSMLSAFAYDVNITYPDLELRLPRLVEATEEEGKSIKTRLGEVVARRKHSTNATVDWQGVVDQFITRFSDRIHFITYGNLSAEALWAEVGTLINSFLDYPADKNASISSPESATLCIRHYLDAPIIRRDLWTPEDAAIHAALEVVADKVCSSLFQIKSILDSTGSGNKSALLRSREVASALMEQLQWTTWKECGRCASSGQFCYIPMPAGTLEDFHSPRCKGLDDIKRYY
jgi:hypothetical protein